MVWPWTKFVANKMQLTRCLSVLVNLHLLAIFKILKLDVDFWVEPGFIVAWVN